MGWNNTVLTDDEALALLAAVSKAMKPNLDDAKGEYRQRLLEQFSSDGRTDRQGIFIGDEKVGDVSIRYVGGEIAIKPGHESEALEDLYEMGLVTMVPVKNWQRRFSRVGDAIANADTGEVVDWAFYQPKTAGTAAITGCKPEVVFPALRDKLGNGAAIAGLLMGVE